MTRTEAEQAFIAAASVWRRATRAADNAYDTNAPADEQDRLDGLAEAAWETMTDALERLDRTK